MAWTNQRKRKVQERAPDKKRPGQGEAQAEPLDLTLPASGGRWRKRNGQPANNRLRPVFLNPVLDQLEQADKATSPLTVMHLCVAAPGQKTAHLLPTLTLVR